MDQSSFPFMRLPTELQAWIVNHVRGDSGFLSHIRGISDLKSLCLVSKHVSDIATRYLYYEVTITRRHISAEGNIKSLLIKPENLQFVRVLKAYGMGPGVSMLMDRLLPHLQKNSLKEIHFSKLGLEEFPMLHQIEFLWHNQKNLRNLIFSTYMVPWLDKFSKEELQPGGGRRSAILKFFTDLRLEGDFEKVHQCTQNNMLWPLQNLDLTVLLKLTFSPKFVDYSIFSTLNTLFADGCFVNLAELRFRFICNQSQTLTLTRMPSLKLLDVKQCNFQGPNLPLVLANDISLSSLYCEESYEMEKLIPLLAQAKGLEYLCWSEPNTVGLPREIDGDLVRAIMSHKDTLRELCLYADEFVPVERDLEAMLWYIIRDD
ncbi:hypothetical protein MMC31_002163 [Peltigera leucophlebia]|nr:hypothetical protein [Peltigera leucophlebia]